MSIKKSQTGRPTKYSSKLAEDICNSIAISSKGVKRLCRDNLYWPSHDTVYRWLVINKDFSDLYARAKRFKLK